VLSARLKGPVVATKRPAAYQEGATGHVLPESQREIRVGSTPHRGNYRARDPANSSTLHNALVPIGIGSRTVGGIVGHVREKDRPMLSTSFAAGRADELADEIDVHRAVILAELLDQHGEVDFRRVEAIGSAAIDEQPLAFGAHLGKGVFRHMANSGFEVAAT